MLINYMYVYINIDINTGDSQLHSCNQVNPVLAIFDFESRFPLQATKAVGSASQ